MRTTVGSLASIGVSNLSSVVHMGSVIVDLVGSSVVTITDSRGLLLFDDPLLNSSYDGLRFSSKLNNPRGHMAGVSFVEFLEGGEELGKGSFDGCNVLGLHGLDLIEFDLGIRLVI